MKKLSQEIVSEIEKRVSEFEPKFESSSVGEVLRVGDGVAVLSGLTDAKMGEVLEFDSGQLGLVLNLKEDEVGSIVFGDYSKIKEGQLAKTTGSILGIDVAEHFLGRVIDPLGTPIDGLGKVSYTEKHKKMLVERIAPGILHREPVNTPLQTGIKAIDSMIPIGRGQRELIIGDRNTGKTAIAIDTIINQSREAGKGVKKIISIYVAIGQKQSKLAQVVSKLSEKGAMKNTIIVAANSSDPVSMQYISPYSGAAIAEYFMEKGEDVLIVFDDLTKHAWAYRQISLILRRPSGREAYPGDIFYLHSRLLERACKLSSRLGGGSITALPIIETQAQDISAFIPTNVISITDGQIYLESDLFFQGVRPAVNPGLSVSRVGGAAQLKAVKQVSGRLRLELAQYNELSAFAQFGSDLDDVSKSKIERGKRIVEILKQPQYTPVTVDAQVALIWYITRGYLDSVEVGEVNSVSEKFMSFLKSKYSKFEDIIYSQDGLTDEVERKLKAIADDFGKISIRK